MKSRKSEDVECRNRRQKRWYKNLKGDGNPGTTNEKKGFRYHEAPVIFWKDWTKEFSQKKGSGASSSRRRRLKFERPVDRCERQRRVKIGSGMRERRRFRGVLEAVAGGPLGFISWCGLVTLPLVRGLI